MTAQNSTTRGLSFLAGKSPIVADYQKRTGLCWPRGRHAALWRLGKNRTTVEIGWKTKIKFNDSCVASFVCLCLCVCVSLGRRIRWRCAVVYLPQSEHRFTDCWRVFVDSRVPECLKLKTEHQNDRFSSVGGSVRAPHDSQPSGTRGTS